MDKSFQWNCKKIIFIVCYLGSFKFYFNWTVLFSPSISLFSLSGKRRYASHKKVASFSLPFSLRFCRFRKLPHFANNRCYIRAALVSFFVVENASLCVIIWYFMCLLLGSCSCWHWHCRGGWWSERELWAWWGGGGLGHKEVSCRRKNSLKRTSDDIG